MGVTPDDIDRLYRETDDPWNFRHSPYEQAKFAATRAALGGARFRSGLEVGCGNGALARHLAPDCDAYTGFDASARALDAARLALPSARFVQGWFPCALPEGDHDLIVLSEVLYFLDPEGLRTLARQVALRWPMATLLCVTWLGDTGHDLQGEAALAAFRAALPPGRNLDLVGCTDAYRIDLAGAPA
jgi:SAM-dependent methyltransferase